MSPGGLLRRRRVIEDQGNKTKKFRRVPPQPCEQGDTQIFLTTPPLRFHLEVEWSGRFGCEEWVGWDGIMRRIDFFNFFPPGETNGK